MVKARWTSWEPPMNPPARPARKGGSPSMKASSGAIAVASRRRPPRKAAKPLTSNDPRIQMTLRRARHQGLSRNLEGSRRVVSAPNDPKRPQTTPKRRRKFLRGARRDEAKDVADSGSFVAPFVLVLTSLRPGPLTAPTRRAPSAWQRLARRTTRTSPKVAVKP